MRNINLKHRMLVSCSREMTSAFDAEKYERSLPFYLASIAFPIDVKKTLTKLAKSKAKNKDLIKEGFLIIDSIESAFSKYNKKVLEEFLKMPEVCVLLLHYLSKVEHEEYREHYKYLHSLATESIEVYESSNQLLGDKIEGQIFDLVN